MSGALIRECGQEVYMKRVLLKLSGEALAGDKKMGFDEPTVKNRDRRRQLLERPVIEGDQPFQSGPDRDARDGHELHLRV